MTAVLENNNNTKFLINNTDFINFTIIKCSINDINIDIFNWNKLLAHIYGLIDINIIFKHTCFSLKFERYTDHCFSYYESVNLSFYDFHNTNIIIHEIFNMINVGNLSIDLSIRLKNKNTIQLKNY